MHKPIPLGQRIRELLWERGITTTQFEADTGIGRRILYQDRMTHRSMLMALAYYFDITVDDLIRGTTAENRF